jgi:hypothetical protein
MVFRRDGLDLATPNRAILCVVFAPLICIAITQSFLLSARVPVPVPVGFADTDALDEF